MNDKNFCNKKKFLKILLATLYSVMCILTSICICKLWLNIYFVVPRKMMYQEGKKNKVLVILKRLLRVASHVKIKQHKRSKWISPDEIWLPYNEYKHHYSVQLSIHWPLNKEDPLHCWETKTIHGILLFCIFIIKQLDYEFEN